MIGNKFVFFVSLLVVFVAATCFAQQQTTTPPSSCELHNDSCASCLKDVGCLWCNNPQKCIKYPVNHVLPSSKDCKLSAARWGVCWLNFEALIISMSIIGAVLIIGVTVCVCKCCNCCCFKKNNSRYRNEELRLEQEREERAARQSSKKAERQRRNDDIRRKYGLVRDSGNNPYQRFDDEMA